MKVLLHYGESKKIKEVDDISELHNAVQQVFNINPFSYFLQKFDNDFQDYVDMDETHELIDKDKIKIIPVTDIQPAASVMNPTYSSLSFLNSGLENSLLTHENIQVEVQDCIILPPHTQQWPETINLPLSKFSKNLLEDLQAERDLAWDKSRELVGHLANYAYSYKPYPNKAERVQICNALINEFPYLRNKIGVGVGGWELKLLNKIKKLRQADNSLEITVNREISKSSGSKVPKHPNINPKKGELNWAPDHVIGETPDSVKIHKKFLFDESLKSESNQNKHKISSLMSLTYSFRREQINNKITIHELRNDYPIFFQKREQFDEFERLTAVCIKKRYFEQAENQGPELYELFRRKKKIGEELLFSKYCAKEMTDMDPFVKIKAETSVGVYVLPYLLRDEINSIFKTVEEDSDTPDDVAATYPTILISGTAISGVYIIVAEGEQLYKCDDFVLAVGMWISFFYTLNIKYPASATNTLKFIQNNILKICGGSIPPKVTTLMNKIKN